MSVDLWNSRMDHGRSRGPREFPLTKGRLVVQGSSPRPCEFPWATRIPMDHRNSRSTREFPSHTGIPVVHRKSHGSWNSAARGEKHCMSHMFRLKAHFSNTHKNQTNATTKHVDMPMSTRQLFMTCARSPSSPTSTASARAFASCRSASPWCQDRSPAGTSLSGSCVCSHLSTPIGNPTWGVRAKSKMCW